MKIECINLSKKFKNDNAVNNINYTFESGKIYGLYGRNGTGKSVFLKMICGLYVPTSGKVLYDGVNLNEKNLYPENMRALIESPAFFPDLTGYENLSILAKIQNKIGDKEIEDALKIVNLIDEKDKKYNKYSLGMKQKLGIAQAIMENPDVIVLDEPFNGIERGTVEKILEFLKEKKDEGKLIIISSHIKEDLEFVSDEILLFDNGTII